MNTQRIFGSASLRVPVLLPFLLAPLLSCVSERTSGITDLKGACNITVEEVAAGDAFVAIRDFAFASDTLHVKQSTRVTWVNCDAAGAEAHTSTSDAGLWTSPLLHAGESFSRVFDAKGTFAYHCTPHPFMHGVVIVE